MARLTRSRLVDMLRHYGSRDSSHSERPSGSQDFGIGLSTEFASEVKAEAGRRQISLKKLFEEMWALYQKSKPKARS